MSYLLTALTTTKKPRESHLLPPSSPIWPNLLHGVNDLSWLHRAWVNDLIYVAQVAVREGGRDVDEGFKLWHLAGHQQELLGGDDIQLHSFSGEDKTERSSKDAQHPILPYLVYHTVSVPPPVTGIPYLS